MYIAVNLQPADGELLGALGHDIDAFEKFYRRHVARVSAFAARRCSSPADVADVVAQTFVRLHEVADQYDSDRGAPRGFVFAVAANVINDHHRAAKRQRLLVFRRAGRDLLDADETDRIAGAIDAARAAPAARDALRSGPEDQSAIVALVAAGVSTTQAARDLGISPVTARVRLFRARRRLRSAMAHHVEDI
ncbi:MAG TPA: RNA polymerase sigma factor [Acidimicrobiales bacterium]